MVIVVALFVVMLLGAAICQTFVAQWRAERQRENRLQALWLLESASQRALQRLEAEADYRGETWDLTAQTLETGVDGRAVIRVEETTEPQPGRRISIDVQYPVDRIHRHSFHRELFTVSTGSGDPS